MKLKYIALAVVTALTSCAQITPVPTISFKITPVPTISFIDHNDAMLERDLVYEVEKTKQRIVVPAGFVTDYASIPGILRPYFERDTKSYQYPAIVHDWLYWNQYPRDKADDIFYDAMKGCGVTTLDRGAIWAGVHWGGKNAWDENKRKRAKGLLRVIPVKYRDPARWPNSWPAYRNYLFQQGVRSRNEPRL